MSYSFEIKNSRDLFKKLQEEYKDLENDELSSRHAINCAMTAWHLTDWTFKEYMSSHGFNDIGKYRESLTCASLKIMHDIAKGGKHLNVSRPKTGITDTVKVDGDFSSDFDPNDFLVGSLDLIMADGTIKNFFDEMTVVLQFWQEYFNSK